MEKKLKIFGEEIIDPKAVHQMHEAMDNSFVVQGALMPDAHLGYSLPIGGVVATKDVVVPAWVGYDIGCGVCTVPTTFDAYKIGEWKDQIFDEIYRQVPVGFKHNKRSVYLGPENQPEHTPWFKQMFFDKGGLMQLGTLGSGNHFIEIGVGLDEKVYITVHSGSRNVGHSTASRYMAIAANSPKPKEGHYPLALDSQDGKNYMQDMNFCLNFALVNRETILRRVVKAIQEYVSGHAGWEGTVNRNHNHLDFDTDLGLWIHRKGATHAKKGMRGVIPGNMRDGCYIVEGKGNRDSLFSSSHGAGRKLGRKDAKRQIKMDSFKEQMWGIKAKVTEGTLDEAPMAYKNIQTVMAFQSDLVRVINHISPIINIKG